MALLSLGMSTAQDACSWALLLSMAAKVASMLVLLARKSGHRIAWVDRHEARLWWTTKLSALAICICAAMCFHLAGDRSNAVLFAALLPVATLLVAVQWRRRRQGRGLLPAKASASSA